ERSGIVLPPGPYDTVGGYVMAQLGRLAVVGDEVTVVTGDSAWRLVVVELDGRRIARVAVEPLVPETVAAETVASETVASEIVAPEIVAPEIVASGTVVSVSGGAETVASESVDSQAPGAGAADTDGAAALDQVPEPAPTAVARA